MTDILKFDSIVNFLFILLFIYTIIITRDILL